MTLKTTLIGIAVLSGLIVFLASNIYFAQIFAKASTTIFNLEPLAPVFALATGLLTIAATATLFNLDE